jgi:hypothetical protein
MRVAGSRPRSRQVVPGPKKPTGGDDHRCVDPAARLLALGADVAADPSLLTAFRDACPQGTLVVHCPPAVEGLAASVEQAVVGAGLDEAEGVEIVILAVPDDEETRAAIARSVDGVFRRPPSFLFLTFDSCRYDVMRDAKTPVLDRYASEVLPAQSPANFTYAAHHAFFAGMLPHVAEARPFYNRFVKQLWGLAKVGEGELVAERGLKVVRSGGNVVSGLRDAGYQTIGAGAMNWFQQTALTCWFERFCFTDTNADAQIDFVLSEVDASRPFFAFINFGETHDPFQYRGKVGKSPHPVQSRLMEWPPVESGPVGRDSEAYWHQVEAVEFLDSRLPRLFDALPGHTVAVVCGDHGEAFGEDGFWGHAVNHPKVLEVPISIFRLDGAPVA